MFGNAKEEPYQREWSVGLGIVWTSHVAGNPALTSVWLTRVPWSVNPEKKSLPEASRWARG